MPTPGRKMYDWSHAQDPYAPHWEDLTAVDRRWWNLEAERAMTPYTPVQRAVIGAAGALGCWGVMAAIVAAVVWVFTR